MATEPYRLTATQVSAKIRAGELTVEEYARSLLSHIEKRDPVVKAWEYLNPEQVIEQAKQLDAVPPEKRGPLHGVAIAVKDVIYTKDMPTQHGSPIYANDAPQVDAGSIIVLRQAGALLLGKTTTTEFAATVKGPKTVNPHSASTGTTRTPGGSSSGSGAAVADFQAPIGLGTQTGGSTIRPGSFNGIYALKPTWNSISREGQKIYSLILDTLGFFARSVEDLQLMADIFDLKDDEAPNDAFAVKGAKFALLKTVVWPQAGPGTQAAIAKAAELLKAHGAEIEEIEMAPELDDLPKWHGTVLHSDGRPAFLPDYRAAKDQLNEFLVSHVENSNKITRAEQLEAFDNIAIARPKVDKMLSGYDAVLVPSVVDEAPEGIESTGSAAFNGLWTALHVPVVNIPGFKGPNGMPVGVSLVAPRYRDRHLLTVSKAVGDIFEVEGGWKSELTAFLHIDTMSASNVGPDSPPLPLVIKSKKSSFRSLFARKPPPSDARVPYTPLKDDEIRLVNLHPGPPSSPVTLTTEIVPLRSADYTALSYVWGDASDTVAVHVDNHIFHATRNLHSALRHIRLSLDSPSDVAPLWIDAVSINQADLAERSSQVARMRDIYTSADLVLTWLGPDLGPGLAYLRELGDHALPRGPPQGHQAAAPKLLPHHVKNRYAEIRETVRVFQSGYWSRVWTMQEYTAPTPLGLFLSGTVWIDRSAFLPATMLYIQALGALRDGLRRKGADASFVDATLWRVRKVVHDHKMSYSRAAAAKQATQPSSSSDSHSDEAGREETASQRQGDDSGGKDEKAIMSRRFNLVSLLLFFRELQATDPRDRIYAPLNLADPPGPAARGQPPLPVDYTLTVRQLYTAVAERLLGDEGYWPFSVLEICRHGVSPDLPSWVPDWRVLPRKVLSRDGTTGAQVVCASRGLPQAGDGRAWRVLGGDGLQVSGVRVDVVAELWVAFDSGDVPRTKRYPSYKLKRPREKYAAADGTVADAFRALAGIESETGTAGPGKGLMQQPRQDGDNDEEVDMFSQAEWQRNQGMISRLNRRRLARTGRGFAGLVPAEAVEGDGVWLIPGANMFYILRPAAAEGAGHVLVGEAYLQGLMHGEAVRVLGGDVEKQSIITLV
ncbi:hypothetical protein EsH8_I_000213 [Colletotrichum jinshuiense]